MVSTKKRSQDENARALDISPYLVQALNSCDHKVAGVAGPMKSAVARDRRGGGFSEFDRDWRLEPVVAELSMEVEAGRGGGVTGTGQRAGADRAPVLGATKAATSRSDSGGVDAGSPVGQPMASKGGRSAWFSWQRLQTSLCRVGLQRRRVSGAAAPGHGRSLLACVARMARWTSQRSPFGVLGGARSGPDRRARA